MDPYLENSGWPGFHLQLIAELASLLVPQVRPKYSIDPERRIYIETLPDKPISIAADIALFQDSRVPARHEKAGATATLEPTLYTAPIAEEHRESYIAIRDMQSHKVVTLIELLSPGNKRPGSVGCRKYLQKRRRILASRVNLVEIDLLRAGLRCPTIESLRSTTDYCVMISRRRRRSRIEVYEWPLRHILPTIPIPLGPDDDDVMLDLQASLNVVYDRAGYDYTLNYSRPLDPPLRDIDLDWTAEIVANLRRLA